MQVARDIVGRLMADPAFVQKLAIEEALAIGSSLAWEWQQRRERFTRELDFVAINTLCLATSTAALVWLMAPNRASGVLKARAWLPARACSVDGGLCVRRRCMAVVWLISTSPDRPRVS
jgi:hypothetical protein